MNYRVVEAMGQIWVMNPENDLICLCTHRKHAELIANALNKGEKDEVLRGSERGQ